MANLLAEGIWPCVVLGASRGEDDKQNVVVRINVKIVDGPSAGRLCTYEDRVDARSSIYVERSCEAIGWKGDKLATLKADCDAWIAATGGSSTVEIKHIEIKNGKRAGEIWDKPNSIGRGPKPLREPSASNEADADEALRKARESRGAPPVDALPPDDRDIPFVSSSMSHDMAVSR